MAETAAIDASAGSQGCSQDLETLIAQSKEFYESYVLTRNLNDMQQAVRCFWEIAETPDLVSLDAFSLLPILSKAVPKDLLHMVPTIVYSLARSSLQKHYCTRQVADQVKACQMFDCALKFRAVLLGRDDNDVCEPDGALDGILELSSSSRQLGLSPKELGTFIDDVDEEFDDFRSILLDLISRWGPEVSLKEIEFVILHCQKSLTFFSCPAKEGLILTKLGWYLIVKSVKEFRPEDIKKAIECCCDGLQLLSPSLPFAGCLIHISKMCAYRSPALTVGDIVDALGYARQAMKLIDAQNPIFKCLEDPELNVSARELGLSLELLDTSVYKDNDIFDYFLHSTMLDCKSNQGVKDLDSAIKFCREALEFFSSNPAKMGPFVVRLSAYLIEKFDLQGKLEDIEEVVRCCHVGLEVLSPTSPWFINILINASTAFEYRSVLRGRREDIDEAVRYAKQAMSVIDSQSSKDLVLKCEERLASVMSLRYHETQDVSDLNAAIDAESRAVDIRERHGVSSPTSLVRLARFLQIRCARVGQSEDMDEAMALLANQRRSKRPGSTLHKSVKYRIEAVYACYG